jgi:hypothetical protein
MVSQGMVILDLRFWICTRKNATNAGKYPNLAAAKRKDDFRQHA